MNDESIRPNFEPVAVIGMSGRFPGASDVDQFWTNLCDGVESISFFRDEELMASGVSPTDLNNQNYVKAGACLREIDKFDPEFFQMNARDAELTDPQQRLFLEIAWEALERAAYDPSRYDGMIGVFAGARFNSYLLHNLMDNYRAEELVGSFQHVIASDRDYLATRVSHALGLTGPSLTVQTACSTALVAVHTACRSLLNHECDMALAGGVSIRLPHTVGYHYKPGGIGSRDGHTRTFDEEASGTVLGSGAGVVVLKCLHNALADGDHIHAIIKGSAINNNGSEKEGMTSPSVLGQTRVITKALQVAGIGAETIGYIETHGTGTAIGDPIEVAALTKVFRSATAKKQFCALGSVKPNMGHLDAASGIVGLIKTTMVLEHQCVPPMLHFNRPNPQLDLPESPFYVNTELRSWPRGDTPLRAGVSSFGFGGTNAHVVLQEAPAEPKSSKRKTCHVLPLSAQSPDALSVMARNLSEKLGRCPDLNLDEVAYTLQIGRRYFAHRWAVTCESNSQAIERLDRLGSDPRNNGDVVRSEPQVTFMFPGHGSQYIHMTRQLYDSEPVYKHYVDVCAEAFIPHLDLDLRNILFPSPGNEKSCAQQLKQACLSPAALFMVEYAMAKLWMHWGVKPQAMIGYSVGEYVAACLSGVFDMTQAVQFVASRCRLMLTRPAGAMLAILLSEEEIQGFLTDGLSLCALSAPAHCIVGGAEEHVVALEGELQKKQIACRRLHVSHAFHSSIVDPLLPEWREVVGAIEFHQPRIPYMSCVTGRWCDTADATDPEHWVRELRQPVRFSQAVETLAGEPNRVFLEVGPSNALSRLVRGHPAVSPSQLVFSSGRHPTDNDSDYATLLNALGELWKAGVEIDWPQLYASEKPQRVPLPTYPFQRRRCWIEAHPRSAKSPSFSVESTTKSVALVEWDVSRPQPTDTTSQVLPTHVAMTPLQQQVAELWQELLGKTDFDIEDNFFAIGGNSLVAVQLVSRVREAFRVDVPLAHFLSSPTIAQLSDAVAETQLKEFDPDQIDRILDELDDPVSESTARVTSAPKTGEGDSGCGQSPRKVHVDAGGDGSPVASTLPAEIDFSLFFFSGDEAQFANDKYKLVLDCARFADRNGLRAIWTPERHFHRFGGLYPNPSLLGAAIASVTERIAIRAGSVVVPLHHPVRIAEDWSVVDNLSHGRVGLGLAAGFHPNDFVFSPEKFDRRREELLSSIHTIRQLWQGQTVRQPCGGGAQIDVALYPKPVQATLPIWLATGGNPQSFIDAGTLGANVLTALILMSVEELAGRIALYRRTLQHHGHDPNKGIVTVMLHTMVGDSDEVVKDQVREPFCDYLNTHFDLITPMAKQQNIDLDPKHLSQSDRDALIAFGFERYFHESSLCGSLETCFEMSGRLQAIGVDEIACLVDFGIDHSAVMESLNRVGELKRMVGYGERPS